ncbi:MULTISPECIES: hypothetical protein [Micrococcaceae]|uniref:hypothetical protein n=1 Tax=unclassified Kocuria TaxID=2649579 RepID=UPI001011302F|nr:MULTISPECIES: hypothetical protein [unclassified Kocuria]
MPANNISRRTIVRGAAWSAPVIAAASTVPAYAASICQDVAYQPVLSTSTITRSSSTSATGKFNPTITPSSPTGPVKPTVNVSFTASATGGKIISAVQNLAVAGQQNQLGYNGAGDLATDGIELIQRGPIGYAARQILNITFDRPVSNLKFTLADFDQSNYLDQVAVSGSPIITNASGVSGSGTPTSPLGPNRNRGDLRSDNTNSRSLVQYTQPTTSVTLEFWSKTGAGSQQIFLSKMSFTASTCP